MKLYNLRTPNLFNGSKHDFLWGINDFLVYAPIVGTDVWVHPQNHEILFNIWYKWKRLIYKITGFLFIIIPNSLWKSY